MIAVIVHTAGYLKGREVDHEVVSLDGRNLRTRDGDGRVWDWQVPTGVSRTSPVMRLVDAEGAARGARAAGLGR
jgi:hypothetical protein